MPPCFPRPSRSALVLALLVAASVVSVRAQVVIEERVAPTPPVTAAPTVASSVAAPSTFTPTVSGTLRLRYESLNEGRYWAYSYIDLTTHALKVSFDGSTGTTSLSDLLDGRFAFRRRLVGSFGFRGYYWDTYWGQTEPRYIWDYTRRTEGIDVYEAEPTVELGKVEAGVPFTLGLDYVEPDEGAHPLMLTELVVRDTAYALRGRYDAGRSPIGTPSRQITVVIEVVRTNARILLGGNTCLASATSSASGETALVGSEAASASSETALTSSAACAPRPPAPTDTLLVTQSTEVSPEIEAKPDDLVTLTAETPSGRLVRVAGADTTAFDTPIPYSELPASRILFVADGEWPDSTATISITGTVGDQTLEPAEIVLLAPKLELELDVDPATYLPVKNDTLTATVRLSNLPEGLRSEVSLELTQDYEFTYLDGTTGARTEALSRDAAERDTVAVQLLSKTWWGVATLRAGVQAAISSDTLAAEVQVPVDTDDDTIADVWELEAANGGRLDLDGVKDDRDWDKDAGQTGSAPGNEGDGIRKEDEYRGAIVDNTTHRRLSPNDREMFLNLSMSTEGTAILNALADAEVVPISFAKKVESLSSRDPSTGQPKSQPLHVAPDSNAPAVGSLRRKGILYQSGVPSPGNGWPLLGYAGPVSLGDAGYEAEFRKWRPQTYGSTIDNIWNANSAPEASTLWAQFPVAETSAAYLYTAAFTGVDLNSDGTLGTVNPLDAVSSQPGPPFPIPPGTPPPTSSANNDPIDGLIGTRDLNWSMDATSVHEVGHAIGLVGSAIGSAPTGWHPGSGDDAMRSGIGPAKIHTYNVTKPKVDLKVNNN